MSMTACSTQPMLFNMARYDRLNKVRLKNPKSDWLPGQLSLLDDAEPIEQKEKEMWPEGQMRWCIVKLV